ncbi:MAG TPA: hypothetical protein PLF54_03670 [Deltaproteobacteria bacterium]|jgi:hypothetical protein|nr:hypothetical protein [Deltaproteobacteria bacterium]HQJ08077.1 hypothetical protein [Deltaproteobacteria bacterium]
MKPLFIQGTSPVRMPHVLVLLWAALCMAAAPLPQGWRLPAEKELHRDSLLGRQPSFFRITTDFNGDGIEDEAMVLVKEKDRGAALFVFVSQENGYKSCKLDDLEETWWLDDVGINVAVPGEYISACGTLYFDCGPGETELFRLKLPGIRYYKAGCSDSIFWWDNEKKRFKRIWTVEKRS